MICEHGHKIAIVFNIGEYYGVCGCEECETPEIWDADNHVEAEKIVGDNGRLKPND